MMTLGDTDGGECFGGRMQRNPVAVRSFIRSIIGDKWSRLQGHLVDGVDR